jgi:hypothetical protein
MNETKKLPSLRECVSNAFGIDWIISSDQFASRGTFVPLSFIDICEGDDSSAQIFAQIMYWFTPVQEQGVYRMKISIEQEGHYWLAKAHGEWFKETRIRRATAKRAVKYLAELGLIELKYYEYGGVAQVPHYRIMWEEFERRMRIWKEYQIALMSNPKAKALEEDKYNEFLKLFAKPTPDQNDSPPIQNDPPRDQSDSPPDQNDPQYILLIDSPEIPQKLKKIDDDAIGEIRLLIHGARFHGNKRLGKFSYIWDKLTSAAQTTTPPALPTPPAQRADPLSYMSVFLKVEAHPFWTTFRSKYAAAPKLDARNAADLWQDIEALEAINATADEIEQVLKWRITPKRQKPYKFEYLLQDVKEIRARAVPPVIEPQLEVAVCRTFHMQKGDFVTRIALFLSGQDGELPTWNEYKLRHPMSALELAAFKGWYDAQERYENQETPPKTPANLRDKIDEFRGSPGHDGWVHRAEHRLNQWLTPAGQAARQPPLPVDNPPPDAAFAAQFEADMAALGDMFGARR